MTSKLLKPLCCVFALSLVGCGGGEVFTAPASSEFAHGNELLSATALTEDASHALVATQSEVCVWDNQLKARLYDCITGQGAEHVELVGFSANKSRFFISNRLSVTLYDTRTGRSIGTWLTGQEIARDIAISAVGDTLVIAYRSGKAEVINTRTGDTKRFDIHRLDINSVALSADGQWAFTGSSDKYVKLWSTSDGSTRFEERLATRVNHVTLNKTASLGFAIDSVDDRVFFDLANQKELSEVASYSNFIEFTASQFVNQDKWLLTGSPKMKMRLYRVADGELIAEYEAKQQRQRTSVLSVAYDGNQLYSETSDGLLQAWPFDKISIK